MVERLDRAWRVCATGFCFSSFGVGGLLLRVLVFRRFRCCRGPPRPASARAAMSSIMPSGCSSG